MCSGIRYVSRREVASIAVPPTYQVAINHMLNFGSNGDAVIHSALCAVALRPVDLS